jgi:hypothetical protein
MASIKFRQKLSGRLRTGKRSKKLNTRTKISENNNNPLLIVEITYLEELLLFRQQCKTSALYNKSIEELVKRVYTWLYSAFTIINPSGILFISEQNTTLTQALNQSVIYGNVKNIIFSLLNQQINNKSICILSNNLDLWSLVSFSAKISFLAINSDNRLYYYNNKTGLDILSKLIGTYKIVNKLGLDSLKYMSLQYLYMLLFYIQFTNKKKNEDFYFDKDYFKNNYKKFSKSNGLGLELIAKAHKFLSYAFLTKPEFLDYFFLGNSSHFSLNLQRLMKLLYFDRVLLEGMKASYDKVQKPSVIPNIDFSNTQPELPSQFKCYTMLWNNDTSCDSLQEQKIFDRISNRYNKKLEEPIEQAEITDNNSINTVENYVKNLLSEI